MGCGVSKSEPTTEEPNIPKSARLYRTGAAAMVDGEEEDDHSEVDVRDEDFHDDELLNGDDDKLPVILFGNSTQEEKAAGGDDDDDDEPATKEVADITDTKTDVEEEARNVLDEADKLLAEGDIETEARAADVARLTLPVLPRIMDSAAPEVSEAGSIPTAVVAIRDAVD